MQMALEKEEKLKKTFKNKKINVNLRCITSKITHNEPKNQQLPNKH
jgi:hypothetical protein